MCDIDLPDYWVPDHRGQYTGVCTFDGRALDQCDYCAVAMSEDGGDYMEWFETWAVEDYQPVPDPTYIVLCEDCALGPYIFDDDELFEWEEHA